MNWLRRKKEFKTGDGVYRAPIGGYYQIHAVLTTFEYTGFYTFQETYRKWWQFWIPCIEWAPQIISKSTHKTEVRLVDKGDIIPKPLPLVKDIQL